MTMNPSAVTNALRVLAVDDDPGMLRYIQTLLELDGHKVITADNGEPALALVRGGITPDLILLDVMMPGWDGLKTLAELRREFPSTRVVMLSGVTDTRKVVEAMRLGAVDYMTKPFRKPDLDAVLAQVSSGRSEAAGAEVEELTDDLFFVAASPAMRRLREQAARIATVPAPVLLLGESGTGKEVMAHLIQQLSPRAGRPFMKINCAAVPGELLESELFGHEAGAFTGATHAKPGKFELCQKGTFFLDEIGEMAPPLQAKLLHVLQDGTFSRLGGRSTIRVDVRILAATNINVRAAIQSRQLREDLYYRLSAFALEIPPLRERKEEIPILLKHFLARTAERYGRPVMPLSPQLMTACMDYDWPGNLRELGNFVKRYLVLGDEGVALQEVTHPILRAGARPEVGQGTRPRAMRPAVRLGTGSPETGSQAPGLQALGPSAVAPEEGGRLAHALEECHWNRRAAAAQLQMGYRAFLQKMRQYGLDDAPTPNPQRLSAGV